MQEFNLEHQYQLYLQRMALSESTMHPQQKIQLRHDELSALGQPEEPQVKPRAQAPTVREGRKVGRNDPCPCGSGKKYKHCHGTED